MSDKILAVIDGDIPLYQTCSAVEHPIDWGNDMWTLHADLKEARELFDNTISEICLQLGSHKVLICLSDSDNWRKSVSPDYKANRSVTRKPVIYRPLREYIEKTYEIMVEPGLEADDCLGIMSTSPKSKIMGCDSVVMVSEDKDLNTVPGVLFNPAKGKVKHITLEQADRFHLYQTLVGDPVDNYKGCPGVGPVSANKVLDEDPSWNEVVAAYEKAGLDEEYALVQARLARILRYDEYTDKKVKLWEPTQRSTTLETTNSSTPDLGETPEKARVGMT